MTEKRFISKGESIINVATDELVNAWSEESAEIIVEWLNEQDNKISKLTDLLADEILKNGELKEENNRLKIEWRIQKKIIATYGKRI